MRDSVCSGLFLPNILNVPICVTWSKYWRLGSHQQYACGFSCIAGGNMLGGLSGMDVA